MKLEIMLQSAIHTRRLSHYEEFVGFTKWLKLNPDATGETLAKRFNRTTSMVSRILSLRRRDCADQGSGRSRRAWPR